MRKSVKIVGMVLIGIIVVIQFFQPEQNLGNLNSEGDFVTVTNAPDSLAKILKNSCYDCHSNRTNYPWYGNISPVSWYLDNHIQEAKENLNLSNFGNLDKTQKIGVLTEICEELESGSMPLKSYLIIHRNSGLNVEDVEAICNWSELAALKIMRE